MSLSWLEQYIDYPDQFPRPNWEAISQYIETHIEEPEQPDTWNTVAHNWLEKTGAALGDYYEIHESANFFVLTNETFEDADAFLRFLEHALQSIFHHLPGIAKHRDHGKYAVMMFDSQDYYYLYISHFYPETGEFSFSGGICIHQGYEHFVFPHQELSESEIVAAHELTHACLGHLSLPLWLNEGIAKTMEHAITNSAPLQVNHEILEQHKAFWKNGNIQQFWSGASFFRPDEGNKLSYHLARLAVKALSHDYERFKKFVLTAQADDGGETAAKACLGGSLAGLISQLLGEGDWAPALENLTNRRNTSKKSRQAPDKQQRKQQQTQSKKRRTDPKPLHRKIRRTQSQNRRIVQESTWYNTLFTTIMVVGFVGIIIGLPFVWYAEPFKVTGEYKGKVTGLYQRQTRYGSPTQFQITLENGKIVNVNPANMGVFQRGRPVIVRESVSKYFRRTHYVFVRYDDPPLDTIVEDIPLDE